MKNNNKADILLIEEYLVKNKYLEFPRKTGHGYAEFLTRNSTGLR